MSTAASENRPLAAPTAPAVWPVLLLVAVAGVCWAMTVERMRGMDMGPGRTSAGSAGSATKRRCLRHCRYPHLLRRRPGAAGALLMGMEQGGFCVGCSGALMVALFALGAMSIVWPGILIGP